MLLSLLLFLQNLCEGGNKENKNFLRYQGLAFSDVDIVAEMAHFGDQLIDHFAQNIRYINADDQPRLVDKLNMFFPNNSERCLPIIDYFATETLPTRMELVLAVQCFRTLAEYCQGPTSLN
jgi:hypothetical protein